jgi:tetratricopeptide (TPR) repeat protein
MLLRKPLPREQLVLLRLAIAVAVGMSTVLAGAAQAAPKKPATPPAHDAQQEKEARAHFDRAEKAFNLGRFEEALAAYQAAYEALPLPAFLFNIAQCHRNLRNREQAIFFYQRYLSLAPDAPNRPVVEDLITDQKRQLEAEAAAQEEAEAAASQRPVNLAARPEAAPGPVAQLDHQPSADEQRQARWRHARWWLLGALGVALAAGVAVLAIRTGGSPPAGSLGSIDARR